MNKYNGGGKYNSIRYNNIIDKKIVVNETFCFFENLLGGASFSLTEKLIIDDDGEDKYQTAETDFYVGSKVIKGQKVNCWLMPFELLLDYDNTEIPLIPPTESTYIDIPDVDGTIVENTVYKNRQITISGVSLDGLSRVEMQKLKTKLVNLLNSTKEKSRSLTFAENDMLLDVKYTGGFEAYNRGNHLEVSFQMEGSPYGRNLFPHKVYYKAGSSIQIVNDGAKSIGCLIKIKGPTTTKISFKIDTFSFEWDGVLETGETLFIDNEDKTCYIIDSNNKTKQAMQYIKTGMEFHLTKGQTTDLIRNIAGIGYDKMVVEYRPRYLWKNPSNI